jgi:hypothetical protein
MLSKQKLESFMRKSGMKNKTVPQLKALLKSKQNDVRVLSGTSKQEAQALADFIDRYITQVEIDAEVESEIMPDGSSGNNFSANKKNRVKKPAPVRRKLSFREQSMKEDKARSDRIKQGLINTRGQIENLNTKKQPSVKKGKDSTQAPSRQRLEDNLLNVSENQRIGGTKPEDAEMNAIEQLVSRIVGRNVRFMEDIPDDDPEFGQGEGGIEYPAGRPDLRMGGQVKRMGHGGAITPEQKKRMTRIAKEYKALRSKKKATAPKVATSKKRSAPFSDIKKAMMNGNKKRTNR